MSSASRGAGSAGSRGESSKWKGDNPNLTQAAQPRAERQLTPEEAEQERKEVKKELGVWGMRMELREFTMDQLRALPVRVWKCLMARPMPPPKDHGVDKNTELVWQWVKEIEQEHEMEPRTPSRSPGGREPEQEPGARPRSRSRRDSKGGKGCPADSVPRHSASSKSGRPPVKGSASQDNQRQQPGMSSRVASQASNRSRPPIPRTGGGPSNIYRLSLIHI